MVLIKVCDRCGVRIGEPGDKHPAYRVRVGGPESSNQFDWDLCNKCGLAVCNFATTPPPQARR